MTKIKHGTKINTSKYIDPEVVLHPVISKWRDTLTIDLGLMNSLKQGQIHPIIFRLKNEKHELIAGARRYFHQKLLGVSWEDIPKEIKEGLSDRDALLIAASENVFRQDFNPWEQARMISDLIIEGGMKIKEVSEYLTLSEEVVRSRRALLELPEKLRKIFEKHDIPIGYTISMKKLKKWPEAQEALLENIIEGMESSYRGIDTIEKANDFVEKIKKRIKDNEELLKKHGACPKCNSSKISKTYTDERLKCNDCDHEWHAETREPWEYYEAKQKMEKMGFDVEEGPDKITLTPKDVAEIVADEVRVKEEKQIEDGLKEPELPEKFRCKATLLMLLEPMIAGDNIQKLEIRDERIVIQLIEGMDLHFNGLRKDYKDGENKARIETATWSGQDSVKRNHDYINSLQTA